MNKSEKKIAQAASKFAKRWQGKGYEKGEVMAAYGFPATMPEPEIVARLFTLYSHLTQPQKK